MREHQFGSVLAIVLLFCLLVSTLSVLSYRQLWLQVHAQQYVEQQAAAFEQALSSLSNLHENIRVSRKVGHAQVTVVAQRGFYHQSWLPNEPLD